MNSVLVFLGEESQVEGLSLMLRQAGVRATAARSRSSMVAALADPCDAIISELNSFLEISELSGNSAQRIAVAERGRAHALEEALGREIDDYLIRPILEEELRLALRRPRSNRSTALPADTIIGVNSGLSKPWRIAERAAGFDADILLTGESGTGKELFARAIHRLSGRSGGNFVPVNCAAIPEGLAESLLFGHVQGAFTGAHADTVGVFARANGGTLFLDEVADLSEEIQVKLLRALQSGEVQPLGSDRTEQADVRVVAATSRDLQAMVGAGQFREDLYYRLAVVPIELPPLRERTGDIEALIKHFVASYSARHQVPALGLSNEARSMLIEAPWPGNVRQLQNAIERLVVLCESDEIGADLVRREIRALSPAGEGQESAATSGHGLDLAGRPLKVVMRSVEAQLIRDTLADCDGKRALCAKRLSISPRALLYKLKEYGIQ